MQIKAVGWMPLFKPLHSYKRLHSYAAAHSATKSMRESKGFDLLDAGRSFSREMFLVFLNVDQSAWQP
jgi:hypothetical protein